MSIGKFSSSTSFYNLNFVVCSRLLIASSADHVVHTHINSVPARILFILVFFAIENYLHDYYANDESFAHEESSALSWANRMTSIHPSRE